MIVFEHLNDKELFEVKHSAELASRFLCNKMDKEAEMEMVSKLTVHRGLWWQRIISLNVLCIVNASLVNSRPRT